MVVKIKVLDERARVPFKKYDDDFCYDVVAVSKEEVAPNVIKYGLGIAIEVVPEDDMGDFIIGTTLRPRSSIYKTGLVLSNSVGTIDAQYRGEICAVFYHVMPDMPEYEIGDKIGQLHIDITTKMDYKVVEELSPSNRGAKGYGSSGLKG